MAHQWQAGTAQYRRVFIFAGRALRLAGDHVSPIQIADTRFALARAEIVVGEPQHAVALAREAEATYREHYRSLVRLASLLVDDLGTCEEIVEEAFVSVWRRGPVLPQPPRDEDRRGSSCHAIDPITGRLQELGTELSKWRHLRADGGSQR